MPERLNSDLPQDTSIDAMRIYVSSLRRLGPGGRGRLAFQLSRDLRRRVEAGVRHRHPSYTDQQVRLGAIRLALGEKLFREVYGSVSILP